MRISLIAAADRGGVIGRGGALPWRLPADLQYFKRVTLGHHVIMGRKTWDAVGRPLPGRTNVVVTRDPARREALRERGAVGVGSLDEALALARAAGEDEAFVIGGAEVYALALPRADRIYLTRVDGAFEGDARFPEIDPATWHEVSREEHEPDDRNRQGYAFCVLVRRPAAPARRPGHGD